MLSEGLLGTQIDAVYHTSIVIRDIEYVYDGGIKTVPAGKTHLEAPWQIIELGTTDLPMDVIMEYVDSLRDIYTAQVCTLHSFSSNHEEANARPGLRSMVS
jgi:hypothetical protein